MAEIEGIPLFRYCPQGKIVQKYGRQNYTKNVHVILGYSGFFKNILTKTPGSVTIATRVWGGNLMDSIEAADRLISNPDTFLEKLIGTTDRESEQYKNFKEECDLYKAEIMKRRLTDEHGARSPDQW